MDITLRKRAHIVALPTTFEYDHKKNKRDAECVKIKYGQIFKMMDTNRDVTKTKRWDQCGRNCKTTSRDENMILQNTLKDFRKTSEDLQRDLASVGVNVDSSTVRKRLLEAGKKARSPCNKQLLTVVMKKNA